MTHLRATDDARSRVPPSFLPRRHYPSQHPLLPIVPPLTLYSVTPQRRPSQTTGTVHSKPPLGKFFFTIVLAWFLRASPPANPLYRVGALASRGLPRDLFLCSSPLPELSEHMGGPSSLGNHFTLRNWLVGRCPFVPAEWWERTDLPLSACCCSPFRRCCHPFRGSGLHSEKLASWQS